MKVKENRSQKIYPCHLNSIAAKLNHGGSCNSLKI